MRLTEQRSALVGCWNFWQTQFTACVISGLVKVRYCRLPTIQRYSVALIGSLSLNFGTSFMVIGVVMEVLSYILVLMSKSFKVFYFNV